MAQRKPSKTPHLRIVRLPNASPAPSQPLISFSIGQVRIHVERTASLLRYHGKQKALSKDNCAPPKNSDRACCDKLVARLRVPPRSILNPRHWKVARLRGIWWGLGYYIRRCGLMNLS